MAAITIECPQTGRQVPVGIETDRYSFEAMPDAESTMQCPACGGEHRWSKRSARLTDHPPFDPPGSTGPVSKVA